MKLLPWIGLAGLLYFLMKPEEVEAPAPPVASSDPYLSKPTIGVAPDVPIKPYAIQNPCFSRVKRNSDSEDLIQGVRAWTGA